MTAARFKDIRQQLDKACEELLTMKGAEYTRGQEDRLSNFKEVAKLLNVNPFHVWFVYFYKHIDAITFYITHDSTTMSESIDSRFMDARNYLDLGYALLREEDMLEDDSPTQVETTPFPVEAIYKDSRNNSEKSPF